MKIANTNNAMFLNRLSLHVRKPLYRNAYAWLLSTGLSSVLGLIYWIIAPRFYPREAVGLNAALISSMILIAGIAQLNLISGLVRYIPKAGSKTTVLVASSYLISMLLALIISAIFIAFWSRLVGLDLFNNEVKLAFLFIPATMFWTIFNLQDGVLAGLRAAIWVPVDNISYGIAKIALMILLAPISPKLGIFASWIIPIIFLLPSINLLIFRRLIPRHIRDTESDASPLHWREISKYIGSNYLFSIFELTSSRLLPVLVIAIAGASAGAYFYPAWAIADSMKLVAVHMTTSLTVEGAFDDRRVTIDGYAFLRLLFGLFVPLVLVVLLVAPLLLRLSGQDYAINATPVFRLLSVAVIPGFIITWYASIARVRQRFTEILFAQFILAAMVLGLSYSFLHLYGLIGVGIASLIGTTIVALGLLSRRRTVLVPIRSRE